LAMEFDILLSIDPSFLYRRITHNHMKVIQ
jgi:hypothetical protein